MRLVILMPIALAVALGPLPTVDSMPGGDGCTPVEIATGACTGEPGEGEIDDGGVVIGVGDEGTGGGGDPGQPGGGGGDGGGDPGQPTDPGVGTPTDPGGGGGWAGDDDPYTQCANGDDFTGICAQPPPVEPEEPDDDRIVITISDVAFFAVDPGAARMEPDGWAVAGLPANFYAKAPVQVKVGQVLNRRTEVRFTPFAYRWTYGDGASATIGIPGASWRALDLPEFSVTPTSHTYARVDDYTVRLEVLFTAEWRRMRPAWTPISGSLAVPADPLRVTVGDADTVLVERDCAIDPSGPGC